MNLSNLTKKQSIPNTKKPKKKQLALFTDIDPVKGRLLHSKRGSVWVKRIPESASKRP